MNNDADIVKSAYIRNCAYATTESLLESYCHSTTESLRRKGIPVEEGVKLMDTYGTVRCIKDIPRHMAAAINETAKTMWTTKAPIEFIIGTIQLYKPYTAYTDRLLDFSDAVCATVNDAAYQELGFGNETLSDFEEIIKAYAGVTTVRSNLKRTANALSASISYIKEHGFSVDEFASKISRFKRYKRIEDLKMHHERVESINSSSKCAKRYLLLTGELIRHFSRNDIFTVQDVLETIRSIEK
jgi:hypothetical protein